jgi:hypothetical protein
VSHGFQPATLADYLLPPTRGPAHVADRLADLASFRDDIRELLALAL